MQITIVDDNAAMGEAYRRALSSAGFQVQYFSNGSAALDWLKDQPRPLLILVDCSMPGESGEEFLIRLEQDFPEIYSEIKIVGLSSYPENSVMVQSFSNKVDLFVEKPDDAVSLVPLVQDVLRKLDDK